MEENNIRPVHEEKISGCFNAGERVGDKAFGNEKGPAIRIDPIMSRLGAKAILETAVEG